jgi:hypothetical protein
VPPQQQVRAYVALSPALLRLARERGALEPPLPAHAVTPELLAELGDVDVEDAEYVALIAASLDSVSLLEPHDRPRRVVAAVDVQEWQPVPATGPEAGSGPSAVALPHPVPWRRIAAVHVDGPEAEAAVAVARAALAADPEGSSPESERALDRCLDHEPGWFGVQEVDELLDDLALGAGEGHATTG